MAPLHCDGRVLSERSFTDVDWLVHSALPALVSRGNRVCDTVSRTRSGVAVVPSPQMADCMLFYRHFMAARRDPDRKLHVSELSCPCAGSAVAGRSVRSGHRIGTLEKSSADRIGFGRGNIDAVERLVGSVDPTLENRQTDCELGDIDLDLLCDNRADVRQRTPSDFSCDCTGAVSHRQPLRTLRRDDARTV